MQIGDTVRVKKSGWDEYFLMRGVRPADEMSIKVITHYNLINDQVMLSHPSDFWFKTADIELVSQSWF